LAYGLSVLLRAARLALAAGEQGSTKLLVSAANARKAAVAGSVTAFGVHSLAEAVGILSGQLAAEPAVAGIEEEFARLNTYEEDFTDLPRHAFPQPPRPLPPPPPPHPFP